MKRTLPLPTFFALFFFLPAWAFPQPETDEVAADIMEYVASVRKDLSEGKVQSLNAVLALSSEESALFWPLYRQYEEEYFDIGDRRLLLLNSYGRAIAEKSLSEEEASIMAENWFELQEEYLALLKEYHQKISIVLGPLAAAQFVQLENRYGMVTDIILASQVPLISR